MQSWMVEPGTSSSIGLKFRKFLPVALILVPLGIHFVFVGCTLTFNWLPLAFLFSHLVFFAVGLWTLHDRKSLLPVVVFIAVVIVTAVLDVIQLGIWFDTQQTTLDRGDGSTLCVLPCLASSQLMPYKQWAFCGIRIIVFTLFDRVWQFSAGICIINLVMQVVTGGLAGLALYLRTEHGRNWFERDCPTLGGQPSEPVYAISTVPGYEMRAGYAAAPMDVAVHNPGYSAGNSQFVPSEYSVPVAAPAGEP